MSRFIFILTKPPYGGEESGQVLKMAIERLDQGNTAAIYFIADGTLSCKAKQKGRIEGMIRKMVNKGGDAYASESDLLARGIKGNDVVVGVDVREDILELMVDDLMENCSSVVSC